MCQRLVLPFLFDQSGPYCVRKKSNPTTHSHTPRYSKNRTTKRLLPTSTMHKSGNPNPNKPMLAFHFLRALSRISKTKPMSSSLQRSRRIKRAAYASMAYAVGSRRAWSRAVLRRLHSRARLRGFRNKRAFGPKRVKVAGSKTTERSQVDALRRLVPGGKEMNLCSLLEETASYVQCLSAQVRLMESVADTIGIGIVKKSVN